MNVRRRDLIAGGPALLLTGGRGFAQPPASPGGNPTREVDVRRDFGAVGDGVADDWRAIEAAGLYLERLGGGRMYFPSGQYRVTGFGRNITVRNNIEYFGDGHSSVIIGSNAAFISPDGAAFGRGSYHSYDYFPAESINDGDQFLRLKNPSDAAKFRPGDIVIARSINAIITPGDVLPYYVEMNRVTAIDGNSLQLEDTIDDGWNGVMAANVTHHVAQGYSIHDLRIECEEGYPLFINGSYKSSIRNCWTRGYALACLNAFTRSMAHDIHASVIWQPQGITASLFEIETGSVRANFHDIDVYLSGSSRPGAQYPLFYCQEFSRRTLLRNIRVAASGVDVGWVAHVMSGGHRFENIDVTAKSIDKVLDYVSCDPAEYQLNSLGLTMSNFNVETKDKINGFNHGFILHNDFPGGEVRNVTISNCSLSGSTNDQQHNLVWFYKGSQRDVLIDGVRGPGLIAMNSELANRGTPAYPLHNVRFRNCEYQGIGSELLPGQASFVACSRVIQDDRDGNWMVPASWSNNGPTSGMAMRIPRSPPISRGDAIRINLRVTYGESPSPAHIEIRAMGLTVLVVQLDARKPQALNLDLELTFLGQSFLEPDQFSVRGDASINDVKLAGWSAFAGRFDRRVEHTIEVSGRTDKPASSPAAFEVTTARLEFRPAESG